MKSKAILLIFPMLLALGIYYIYKKQENPTQDKIAKQISSPSMNQGVILNSDQRVLKKLASVGESNFPEKLVLLAFKEERILEVYLEKENRLIPFAAYPFTGYCGELGPKLKQGDKQIPEGIYSIEYLNPNSKFHLSMKVNYPNSFDKKMAIQDGRTNLGGDIFIHGKDVTIGCIPIGDEAIEELFLLVNKATKNQIEVIICPKDFRKDKERPSIKAITWEKELYDHIESELKRLFP